MMTNNTTFPASIAEREAGQLGFYPNAKPVGIIILLFCIATVIANTILIISYNKCRNLHTAFNMYILNLSIGDLIQAVGSGWANMELYYNNGWRLGKTACTVYLYLYNVSSLFLFYLHLVVSINRLWAVTSPFTYAKHHSRRAAVFCCMVLWLYAHAWILPALIPDALYYRDDSTLDCWFNVTAQPNFVLWSSYIGYDLPIALIIAIYPVICWKFWQYRKAYFGRKFKPRITPSVGRQQSGLSQSYGLNTLTTGNALELHSSFANTVLATMPRTSAPTHPRRRRLRNPDKVFHFKIISCLVFGVTVCWTPICGYYIVIAVIPGYTNLPYIAVASVLYFFNPLLNPIIYPLASREWRKAFRKTLGLKI